MFRGCRGGFGRGGLRTRGEGSRRGRGRRPGLGRMMSLFWELAWLGGGERREREAHGILS